MKEIIQGVLQFIPFPKSYSSENAKGNWKYERHGWPHIFATVICIMREKQTFAVYNSACSTVMTFFLPVLLFWNMYLMPRLADLASL